jgi:hypothetical protein
MRVKVIKFKREELLPELFKFLVKNGDENYIRHFLFWTYFPVDPLRKCENNTMVNNQYKSTMKMYETYLKEKDYSGIFVLLDKETRMGWFIKNYKKIYKDVGEEIYFKLLRENLVYVDNHDTVRKHYSKLICLGKDHLLMMSKKERKQFDKLPENLTIYRGTSSDKEVTPSNIRKLLGNSWSLDKEISIWFTVNHSPKFRGSKYLILLTYKLKKSEVISYFTDRNENEIFLDYTKIDLDRITYEYIPKDYKVKVKINKK